MGQDRAQKPAQRPALRHTGLVAVHEATEALSSPAAAAEPSGVTGCGIAPGVATQATVDTCIGTGSHAKSAKLGLERLDVHVVTGSTRADRSRGNAVTRYGCAMTSIEVTDATAAVVRDQAARAGVSVDAYIWRLALIESARQHGSVLDEAFYADAEAERLAS